MGRRLPVAAVGRGVRYRLVANGGVGVMLLQRMSPQMALAVSAACSGASCRPSLPTASKNHHQVAFGPLRLVNQSSERYRQANLIGEEVGRERGAAFNGSKVRRGGRKRGSGAEARR